MASLHPCFLCKAPERIRVTLDNNKKPFLIYSIFIVLLIEWFSLAYQFNVAPNPKLKNIDDQYLFFWYPLLTQAALFVVFFSFYLWKERLHFCFRKSATTFYLSLYYLLGVFGVLFCLQANLYYSIVSFSSIGIATFLFFVSLFNKSE